jgi:hypothetical protein
MTALSIIFPATAKPRREVSSRDVDEIRSIEAEWDKDKGTLVQEKRRLQSTSLRLLSRESVVCVVLRVRIDQWGGIA